MYMTDNYGLYDNIKRCEERLFSTKPECIKKIELIPYYEDLGYGDNPDLATLLLTLDVRLEKETEYNRFAWTGTADGYGKDKSRKEVEDTLVLELKEIIDGIMKDEEIDEFWEDVPWDRDWKPLP